MTSNKDNLLNTIKFVKTVAIFIAILVMMCYLPESPRNTILGLGFGLWLSDLIWNNLK